MSEKGSDAQFAELANTELIDDQVHTDDEQRATEEQRVSQETEALDEPGEQYPDPDETPAGDPPKYDPTPPA